MENSTFKLVLTNTGKKIIEDRLTKSKTTTIPLTIALGAGDNLSSSKDTGLYDLKTKVKPSLIEVDNELKQGIHINALFPAGMEQFDIKEIGLIVEDGSENGILLGRYANKKPIARMTSQIELLLDIVIDIGSYPPERFIINSKDYKPEFSLTKATEQRYGNVRFANENDILKKKLNLALSTNILTYANILPKSALVDTWSEPKIFSIAGKEKTLTFPILGLSYSQFAKNQICILLNLQKNSQYEGLIYFFYTIDAGLSEVFKYTYHNYLNCDAFPIDIVNGRIKFLLIHQNINEFFFAETLLKLPNIEFITDSKDILKINTAPGNIFYFNNTPYAIGGYNNHLDAIAFKEGDKLNSNFKLINKRKKPLIHLIQDRIYILGGSQPTDEKSTSVEIFDPVNKLNYTPFTSQIAEIENTENVTSCVVGNKIYIFFIKQFGKEYNNEKFYYCYDYLGNNWKKQTISNYIKLNNSEKNLQGKAITIGDEIYLFFTNSILNDNKNFELSLIKLRPV
ncbi:MAG: hypothetical protein REH83_05525 [Rickettsiella sp.]|nr:hypothetical protein [Rickettsiella sp.]